MVRKRTKKSARGLKMLRGANHFLISRIALVKNLAKFTHAVGGGARIRIQQPVDIAQ